jgi:hypothetical protein
MKSLKIILALAMVTMFVCSSFAAEGFTVAFDKSNQRMNTVFWSDVPVDVTLQYDYEGSCGAIEVFDNNTGTYQPNNYHFGQDLVWCSATLEPEGLIPGDDMTFGVRAHILNPENPLDTLFSTGWTYDVLRVTSSLTSDVDLDYIYAQGCPNESLPTEPIDIGQSYCVTICHGTYLLPIFCEDPGYNPDLLEITIENTCGVLTECNSDQSCPGLAEFDDNFQSQVLVFPGCQLLLQISYCGFDEGCICITRGDFILPVELNDFEAIARDNSVELNWSTASETDIEKFVISRDGENVAELTAGNTPTGADYRWTDNDALNGHTYEYVLSVVNLDGSVNELDNDSATPRAGLSTPTDYSLAQNYPNPFNSETSFSFSIPAAQHVSLKVYDVLGRSVATIIDRDMTAGSYIQNWSAKNLATGIYMYTLTAGEFTQSHKMLYLK